MLGFIEFGVCGGRKATTRAHIDKRYRANQNSKQRHLPATAAHVQLELFLPSEEYSETLGACLALNAQVGDALLLHGELGAGKTSLARGYIRCFLGDADYFVTSPTYVLMNQYPDEGNSVLEDVAVAHLDLWRLEKGTSSRQIADFQKLYSSCVTIIEWPDRLEPEDFPQNRIDIYLSVNSTGRMAKLVPSGPRWKDQVQKIENVVTKEDSLGFYVLHPQSVVESY